MERQLIRTTHTIEAAVPRITTPTLYRPSVRGAGKYWVGPDAWYYVPPSLVANSRWCRMHHRGTAVDYLVRNTLSVHASFGATVRPSSTYRPTRREQ
ncbi:MAG: hypothetical protein ACKOI2_12475 [Actinomycetota bacterium]